MKYIQSVQSIFIASGMVLAVGGIAAMFAVVTALGLPFDVKLMLTVFFEIVGVYSSNRLFEKKEDIITYPKRTRVIHSYEYIFKIFSLVSVVGIILCSYRNLLFLLLCSVPFLLHALYVFKWNAIGKLPNFRLKDFWLAKDVTVAFGWSLSFVFFPIVYYSLPLNMTHFVLFFFFFFICFANTLLFDIRDVDGDRANKVFTIPVKLGIRKSKRIVMLSNLIAFVLLMGGFFFLHLNNIYFFISLGAIYCILYTIAFDYLDKDFVCDVLADGMLVIIGLLAFIGSHLL